MSVFDFLLFDKLLGAVTHTQIDRVVGSPGNASNTGTSVMTDLTVVSNPGTTYATVFDITGKGLLLMLTVEKLATVNSVFAVFRLTLDGVIIASDAGCTSTSTSQRGATLVGQCQDKDAQAPTPLPPILLPFNTGVKFEIKYSATPGASEDINVEHMAVYT